jgi:hypothetical protein
MKKYELIDNVVKKDLREEIKKEVLEEWICEFMNSKKNIDVINISTLIESNDNIIKLTEKTNEIAVVLNTLVNLLNAKINLSNPNREEHEKI